MKICCYTCITGNYDRLSDPLIAPTNIDFICFTDNTYRFSNVWKIRSVPKDLYGLSDVKQQRIVKICPHRYLPEYDISIWIDGNFDIIGDLNELLSEYDINKISLYVRIHPSRNCIYDEANACINLRKDKLEVVNKQIAKYRREGYPLHIGMAETCILLRRHNDVKCKMLCNLWATELLLNSHRDQLSFNYACWKLHFLPGYMTKEFKAYDNRFFKWRQHG